MQGRHLTRLAAALASSLLASAPGCRSQTLEPVPVAAGATPDQGASASSAQTPPAARSTSGEATLLLMADIRGVLKPCGCTVDLQKGGFDRLAPFLAKERSQHPGATLVHAGPLFFEDAEVEPSKVAQRERQAEVTAELLGRLDVALAGATAVDMAAGGEDVAALLATAKIPATAANLMVPGLGLEASVVQRIGGLDVGVFALASPDHAKTLGASATVSDPTEAARAAVASLAGRADVVVLLSALGLRKTKRLVRQVPGIQFAVVGGLGEHPVSSDEAELVGATRVMQFHREGRWVGRLTIRLVDGAVDAFVDASAPSAAELEDFGARIARLEASLAQWKSTRPADDYDVRSATHHLASLQEARARLQGKTAEVPTDRSSFSFHVTPLEWDLPQDADVLAVMDSFNMELKDIALANAGTLPEAKPGEAVYVGVGECLDCHDEAQTYWDNDRHEHAWETLVEQQKTFDAECVSCHVTGWGKAGGSILGKTEGREDVQCEACHGPGSLHVESEGDVAVPRAEPDEDLCVQCHNSHHSPHFEFDVWKKKIMVPGHGKPLSP